jgi:polyphosphate glucokinase
MGLKLNLRTQIIRGFFGWGNFFSWYFDTKINKPWAGKMLKLKNKGKKPYTLSVDVGGTGLKASVLDARGRMVVNRVVVDTPQPCPPGALMAALEKMARVLPAFDRVSVGFPGVVRDGVVITAPPLKSKLWSRFPLVQVLERKTKKPVRLLNDADVHGLAVIQGKGLELVVTLGTGVGTALFNNGRLMQRMELAHHPVKDDKTYNQYIGDKVLKTIGKKKWNQRVKYCLGVLNTLLNYDRLYIGGGNARHVNFNLPKGVNIVANEAGVLGGIALWRKNLGLI